MWRNMIPLGIDIILKKKSERVAWSNKFDKHDVTKR